MCSGETFKNIKDKFFILANQNFYGLQLET